MSHSDTPEIHGKAEDVREQTANGETLMWTSNKGEWLSGQSVDTVEMR